MSDIVHAVTHVSRELIATAEGRRMAEEQLLKKARELGDIIPLTQVFLVDPFERYGDMDSPMSTKTTAVLKLSCKVVLYRTVE